MRNILSFRLPPFPKTLGLFLLLHDLNLHALSFLGLIGTWLVANHSRFYSTSKLLLLLFGELSGLLHATLNHIKQSIRIYEHRLCNRQDFLLVH
jgi:hypothetical protein